jgi:hypothetical protein
LRSVSVAIFLTLLAAGCTALTSETAQLLQAEGRAAAGVNYALPKGMVDVVLSLDRAAAKFILTVDDPKFIPDPEHRYFLRYRALPNYEDKITVEMNKSGKPFLKQVKSDTTDKTGEILVNLVKAATLGSKFESSPHDGKEILASITLDLAQAETVRQAARSLNTAAVAAAEEAADECVKVKPDRAKPAEEPRAKACEIFEELAVRGRAWRRQSHKARPLISLDLRQPDQIDVATPADCTVGLCYRPVEPFFLTFSLDDVVESKTILLPNLAAPVALDIRRAFFVQKVTTIDFDEATGLLALLTIDKKSELLEISKLPISVLEAITQALRLRVKFYDSQASNAAADAELIKAKAQLQKARSTYETAVRDAAARRGGGGVGNVTDTARRPFAAAGPLPPVPPPPGGTSPLPSGPLADTLPPRRTP